MIYIDLLHGLNIYPIAFKSYNSTRKVCTETSIVINLFVRYYETNYRGEDDGFGDRHSVPPTVRYGAIIKQKSTTRPQLRKSNNCEPVKTASWPY